VSTAARPILETIDLEMVYHVGKVEVHALRGVNLQVQKGEFCSIVGPSGSGKSTLLHLLGGLASPSRGRVLIDGGEISRSDDAGRTRGNGPVPRARLMELLEMVGLPHKAEMKPLDLSGGEQQRIAIARALVMSPPILLADEPTGNLDSVNSANVLELMRELNERLGQTVVMITHNPDAAETGHRIFEMKDGHVVRTRAGAGVRAHA
jgi:putative ABC transport system ATP-binding protein